MANKEKEIYMAIYRTMLFIREFEEKLSDLFTQGRMHGTCHLCVGEEATYAASIAALKPQDYKMGTHRGHGIAIASGVNEKKLMSEFFGRVTGICKGMGGSMHITDPGNNLLGTNGIVAGSIPIATGAALSIKRKSQKDKISVCFFGDGATNEGVFYETLNMAMLWKLPVLYICTNNQYAMSTHYTKHMAVPEIERKAHCFGMKTVSIDGNDAVQVYKTVKKARKYVLEQGPMLVVENTYRISGHSKSDTNAYRSESEIEFWKTRCPVKRFAEYLLQNGLALEKELVKMAEQAKKAILDAVEYAEQSPYPKMQEVSEFIFMQQEVCK